MKKFRDGIYAHSTRGEDDVLVFRKAKLMGKLYLAYIKGNILVALKDWDEVQKEMESSGPYIDLAFNESGAIINRKKK